MRLPWLQVDADGATRGEMLGRLLGVGEVAGIGMAIRLWMWALELAPDGDFSGGPLDSRLLAAGIGWSPDDATRLEDELSRVGLVEGIRAGSVRVKGLERYRRAWEKNKRRKPASKVPVTGAEPARTGAEPARKTETETDKKKISAVDKPPRRPSTAESLFAWWQDRRAEAGLTTEAQPAVGRLNSKVKSHLEHYGRPELELRYRAYLGEPKYKPLDPPWPWQMFLAVVDQMKPKASTAVRIVKAGDLYADP